MLDRSVVDEWIKCDDTSSFVMARRLLRQEGLLCGGSSGSNVYGALKAAKRLKKDQRCVVVLPDSIRNYMTKHLNDDWMYKHGHVSEKHSIGIPEHKITNTWWAAKTVGELPLPTPTVAKNVSTCKELIDLMAGEGYEQVPIVDEEERIVGVVTEGNLFAKLSNGRVKPDDSISNALFKQFRVVSPETKLSELASIFDYDYFALVKKGEDSPVSAVVRRIDLLNYISSNE